MNELFATLAAGIPGVKVDGLLIVCGLVGCLIVIIAVQCLITVVKSIYGVRDDN